MYLRLYEKCGERQLERGNGIRDYRLIFAANLQVLAVEWEFCKFRNFFNAESHWPTKVNMMITRKASSMLTFAVMSHLPSVNEPLKYCCKVRELLINAKKIVYVIYSESRFIPRSSLFSLYSAVYRYGYIRLLDVSFLRNFFSTLNTLFINNNNCCIK